MDDQEMMIEESALTEEERRFTVDDDQKAEWCLEKIREAKADLMKWIEFYVEQTDKVKAKCEARIAFFEGMLQRYFATVPHKETKTQESYALPSGKLVLKKQGPDYERDDALILAWLKANDGDRFVKTKESVDWAELKKKIDVLQLTAGDEKVTEQVVFTETGEVVPGITVTARPDVFKVEVKQ
jgi:hypothetical protein